MQSRTDNAQTASAPVKAAAKGVQGNGGQRRNEALIERDTEIYKDSMRGLSVRAIQEKFGFKSENSAWIAIKRGKQHVIDKGIDIEETRLTIHQLFEQTLGALGKQVMEQQANGSITEFVDAEGNKSWKKIHGIDPRTAGELSRSLHRWAEFAGLMDRAPEASSQQTTLIQLSAPAAGADFESRYSQMPSAADAPALEASAAPALQSSVVSEGGPGWGEPVVEAA
jgi:hypothetical protein